MGRLILSLTLAFAPFLALAYHHAGKVLLSHTEAARYLEGGGAIATAKLDAYHSMLRGCAFMGLVSALLLAIEVAQLLRRRCPDPVGKAGSPLGEP